VEAGEPEFQVTLLLRRLFPEHLPTIIAVRTDWQGWLMKDSGLSAEQVWFFPQQSIKPIGASRATLQQASTRRIDELPGNGISDQRARQVCRPILRTRQSPLSRRKSMRLSHKLRNTS
jgi:hypothetical protein